MRPFVRPVPSTWWLKRRVYFLFILRELTSVFIAVYLILFLNLLYQLSLGRQAYEIYLDFLATPGMIVFHVVALVAALYHTITWFGLLPNIIVVRIGENRVSSKLIAGANYVPWIAVSAIIFLILKG
ncbi:MAG: fumarate reductase subunit C [Chloroflexi bacterium]|nr:fumarate reductase subunit C [Chloroflexota bacterium]MCH8339253.1 fumarate reductase subunit C [Chloroflexota bacterium]MCH8341054.1 fumarate reductase subunit C [Chloroflexota bacterium]TDI85174.1 MAG: fumarate reductase subunit C [Chloroflexota bacterium]